MYNLELLIVDISYKNKYIVKDTLHHPIPEGYIYMDLSLQVGGGLEYLHCSPASRRR
jgi:hypothetical protein